MCGYKYHHLYKGSEISCPSCSRSRKRSTSIERWQKLQDSANKLKLSVMEFTSALFSYALSI